VKSLIFLVSHKDITSLRTRFPTLGLSPVLVTRSTFTPSRSLR